MRKLLFFIILPLSCFAEFSDLHIKEVEYVFERWIEPSLNRVSEEKRENIKLLCEYISDEVSDKGELLELIREIESDYEASYKLTPTESHWLSSKVLSKFAHEQYFKLMNFDREYLDELLNSDQNQERELGLHLLSTQSVNQKMVDELIALTRRNGYKELNNNVKAIITQVVENPDSDDSIKLTDELFSSDEEYSRFCYALMFNIKKAEFHGYKESESARDILNNSAKRLSLDSDELGAFLDLFDEHSIKEKRKYLISELERLGKLEKMIEASEKGSSRQGKPGVSGL